MDKPTTGEIDRRMDHYPPTPEAIKLHEDWRAACKWVGYVAVTILPPGRELSLVLTKLEEALMHGNAGIAREISGKAKL